MWCLGAVGVVVPQNNTHWGTIEMVGSFAVELQIDSACSIPQMAWSMGLIWFVLHFAHSTAFLFLHSTYK